MMNFGLGDLVDRLEKYFGARLTRLVLSVLTISALLIVSGAAVQQVVYPLVLWAGDLTTGNPALASARTGINWLTTIIVAVLLVAWFVTAAQTRARLKEATRLYEQTIEARDEVDRYLEKAKLTLAEVEKTAESASTVMDRVTSKDP